MPDGNHLSDESSHPHLTPQSLEVITAATIATLNQHLASIDFPPRMDATPSDESIPPMAWCISDTPGNVTAHLRPNPRPGFTQLISYE